MTKEWAQETAIVVEDCRWAVLAVVVIELREAS